MVAVTLAIGWLAAIAGHTAALAADASIAGSMGLVAALCFALALALSPRYGLVARSLQRRARRRAVRAELASAA